MKINRMWALFYKGRFDRTVKRTRQKVIEKAVRRYGRKWPELKKRFGYTIEKVVVLREDEFEELLAKANDTCVLQFPKEGAEK